MSDISSTSLAIIAGLILLQAIITLAYAALVNTRTGWLRDLAEDGNAHAANVLHLIQGTDRLTITYQTLRILIAFSIATFSLTGIAEPLAAANPNFNDGLFYFMVLAVIALVTLIIGDIVPEAVGSSYAQSLCMMLFRPMQLIMFITSPLMIGVLWTSRLLSSLMGSSKLVNTVTEEEIMTLIDAGHTGGTIEDQEKAMIYSVLQLDQTRASEVMIPRIDVVAVDIEKDPYEAGAIFIQSGYSRIPVYEEHIDQVRGILYAKDLLAYAQRLDHSKTKTIKELMRQAHFIPETKQADELLKELRTRKVHMAVVVDEYGGTAGVVTIENIIEEIIGDIRDEYDFNEEAEYTMITDDEYVVDASIDLDHFNNLVDVELPTEDTETLGGYFYMHFGRVPHVNETIETDELTLQVRSVEGRRIRKVHVIRKRHSHDDDDQTENVSDDNVKDKSEAYDGS